MLDQIEKIDRIVNLIKSRITLIPKLGIILGSGLGDYGDTMEEYLTISYSELPGFPVSTVAGHSGQFQIGYCMGYPTMIMKGRFHSYEGYTLSDVTLPVRVMKGLGIETLIVTNAAGGISDFLKQGDLMIIKDHLNLSGGNPLVGKNLDNYGTRFPDLTFTYDHDMRQLIRKSALYESIDIKEGIYAMMLGPSYETPAEIRMLKYIGADAVGMSTVPEVIVAIHSGIRVAAISCITNMAAGILDQPLRHEKVMETAEKAKWDLKACLDRTIMNIKRL